MITNEQIQEKIADSLEQIARMKAYSFLESPELINKSNGEKIYFLYQMGFKQVDISVMAGTTLGTVKKEISNRKNKDKD